MVMLLFDYIVCGWIVCIVVSVLCVLVSLCCVVSYVVVYSMLWL